MSRLMLSTDDLERILKKATRSDSVTCRISDAIDVTISSAKLHSRFPSIDLAARIRLRLLNPSTLEIQHRASTHKGWTQEILLGLLGYGVRTTILKLAAGAVDFPSSGYALVTLPQWKFIDIDLDEAAQAIVIQFAREPGAET